jgi:hypothetical protein
LAPRLALQGLSRILRRLEPERTVIVGGPRSGKSTLANLLRRDGIKIHGGEELRGVDWSQGSAQAATWLDEPGPWICENVAMARALRKWLTAHHGSPADVVVVLRHPVADRTTGQLAMAKGVETVWREVAPDLASRGTAIISAKPFGPSWVGVNEPASP